MCLTCTNFREDFLNFKIEHRYANLHAVAFNHVYNHVEILISCESENGPNIIRDISRRENLSDLLKYNYDVLTLLYHFNVGIIHLRIKYIGRQPCV